MLFAQDGGSLFGLAGLIVAILTAAGAFLVAWFNNSTRLLKRIDELTTQVFKLQDDSGKCLQREADLKAELIRTNARIELIEKTTGVIHQARVPGIVVADYSGIIQEFSPACTVFLGWTSAEMVGQSITQMVPPDDLEKHSKAFAAAVSGGILDPTKRLLTYALDKKGDRVPVEIRIRRWSGDVKLITAVISERARGEFVKSEYAKATVKATPSTPPTPADAAKAVTAIKAIDAALDATK